MDRLIPTHTLPDGRGFDPLAIRPTEEQVSRMLMEEAAAQQAAAAAFNPTFSMADLLAQADARDAGKLADTGASLPHRPTAQPVEYLDPDTGLPIPAGTPTIESWDEVNIDAFTVFLRETKKLTLGTEKTYRSAFRRIIRSFSLEALRDPTALQAYRSSLPLGSRNTFDASWPVIARFMVNYGISMPLELPAKPRIRFTHPLVSDLLTIGGMMNYNVVPEITWQKLVTSRVQDMAIMQACRRICEFQTGMPYSLPPKPEHLDAPIVPSSAKLDPMPEWRIKWILDSERNATQGVVEQESAAFFQRLVALGVNGFQLREFATLYCLTRNNIKAHFHKEQTMTNLFSFIHPLKLSSLKARLLDHGNPKDVSIVPLW